MFVYGSKGTVLLLPKHENRLRASCLYMQGKTGAVLYTHAPSPFFQIEASEPGRTLPKESGIGPAATVPFIL